MVTDQLLNFIKDQMGKGVSREAIAKMLIGQGWAQLDVDQAWNAVNPMPVTPRPAPIATPAPVATPVVASAPVQTPIQPVQPAPTYTPPVQNFQQPNMMAPNTPVQKKSHMGMIIGIIVVALLLVGGGVYAYMTYFGSSLSPKDIITNSAKASMGVRSF